MPQLHELRPKFHKAFPKLAMGKYAHFFLIRHSQSFPIFQTDGVLNTVRTQAGLDPQQERSTQQISRLVMFKRKQTTPERLAGRQLLREFGFTGVVKGENNYCEYNSTDTCKHCPDCILYGFGTGSKGSERSKIYSDSAFSIQPYDISHKTFTFNATSENGTMSEAGEMRSSINALDHVLPEVAFPSVETLRDPTYEGFLYVLGNLLRTKRYGATESRTGTMSNHVISISFCDAEVFSNLHFTQALYDAVAPEAGLEAIKTAAETVMLNCLEQEPVRSTTLSGNELHTLLSEVAALYRDERQLRTMLTDLCQQTLTYAENFGAYVLERKQRERAAQQTIPSQNSTSDSSDAGTEER